MARRGVAYSKGRNTFRGKGSRSRPSSSHTAQAIDAFKTGMLVQVKSSGFSFSKSAHDIKNYFILTALSGLDTLQALDAASTANPTGAVADKCGIRDWKTTLYMKNVCTYQLRLRVTTWVARQEMIQQGASYGTQFNTSLNQLVLNGFEAPYTHTVAGFNDPNATDISVSLFQNPLWVHYFRALKVKNYTLMPYRSRVERLHVLRKRPGLIDRFQNTAASNTTTGFGKLIVSRTKGITTVVKTIEVVGEIVNDATIAPAPIIFTSPSVLLLQQKTEFEAAVSQPYAFISSVGDPNPPAPAVALTGQPWNYMFPAPSSSSSVGTSAVLGALTSGL